MSDFKVRFAPSPTGFLHVGNARIALANYLFARSTKARLLLRIDDTDLERSRPEYEAAISQDLARLGVERDIPPDGAFGGVCDRGGRAAQIGAPVSLFRVRGGIARQAGDENQTRSGAGL